MPRPGREPYRHRASTVRSPADGVDHTERSRVPSAGPGIRRRSICVTVDFRAQVRPMLPRPGPPVRRARRRTPPAAEFAPERSVRRLRPTTGSTLSPSACCSTARDGVQHVVVRHPSRSSPAAASGSSAAAPRGSSVTSTACPPRRRLRRHTIGPKFERMTAARRPAPISLSCRRPGTRRRSIVRALAVGLFGYPQHLERAADRHRPRNR
jgi:hypothetical protein